LKGKGKFNHKKTAYGREIKGGSRKWVYECWGDPNRSRGRKDSISQKQPKRRRGLQIKEELPVRKCGSLKEEKNGRSLYATEKSVN